MGKGGGSSTETVDSIPAWAQPYFEKYLGEASDLYGEGGMGTTDPLTTESEEDLLEFARGLGGQTGQLKTAMDDMFNISQGVDPINTEALKNAATLRAKQEMVPSTQLYAGMGATTAGVGGGRQQLDQSDAANRLAAQFAQFDYDAETAAQAREDAARAGLGTAFKDYAGAGTFGADIIGEVGKTRQDSAYEELMKFRDAIDFRQPTQTAVQGGK